MQQLKTFFEKWGIHSFLLPVFFIIHNYTQYYGMVSVGIAFKTLGEIFLFVVVFFLLVQAKIRNINKSLQLTTLAGFVFLFFGVVKDFLTLTLKIKLLSKYSVLLPLTLLITIFFWIVILKKKDFKKSNLFQNVLLIILILVDAGSLFFSQDKFSLNKNQLVKNNIVDINKLTASDNKPDVYYLLFDCYPGTSFLKNYMQYDNSSLTDTLQNKGFHVINNPKSNYNRTAFSLASTLNFEYLQKIKNNVSIQSKNYNQAQLATKYSVVPKMFTKLGYKVYNLSIFDIDNQKSMEKETFLTLPDQRFLLYNTLFERIQNDLFWNLVTGKYQVKFIQKMVAVKKQEVVDEQLKKRTFNNKVIDSLQKIPSIQEADPKFIYAHFYLPHPPFFYTENGEGNDLNFIVTEESLTDQKMFLSYLRYTNRVMLTLINKILKDSKKPPVIIVQSDHGFRDFKDGPKMPYLFFKNYSAFYFPDKNYSMLYDTLSNINTFPIIFNKYFNTNIPLQKDTSTFLAY